MDVSTVAIAVFEGVEELDAIGPYETFSVAGDSGGDLDVSLRTLEPTDRVTCAHGLRIEPDGELSGGADLIVVPGGGWTSGEGGVRTVVENGRLPAALADWSEAGREDRMIASVCTGAMVLAEAGVLDCRPATTHASALSDLRETGAEVVDARIVDDGDLLTAGGVTAGIDLALHLVARICGDDVARATATTLEHDRPSDVYRS
ncbi:DJ-1/PfpI family protein [Saliphagus infecundisoli]|uniref:DJ-1/PfpI family protein n=1 Tax=Saliphagus infecundisoli TaxID=1849069 RepID=A0ABD5QC81_9EURY|nr:DJ-1/PfpI family protein [Saliphagus infecundisoli]